MFESRATLCGVEPRICPKRWQEERGARQIATHAFRKSGWFLDVKDNARQRILTTIQPPGGALVMYCPKCAQKKHM